MAKVRWYFRLIITLLVGIGSWALFSIARLLVESALENAGIMSEMTQMLIIVVGVIVVLSLVGFGFKTQLKKLVG